MSDVTIPEIYSADDLARAAGVPRRLINALLTRGELRPVAGTRYFAAADTIRAGRQLRTAQPSPTLPARADIFAHTHRPPLARREPTLPAFVSLCVHGTLLILAVWLTTGRTETAPIRALSDTTHLVFIVSPGPGGGGGGGGLRAPRPPATIERNGIERPRLSVPAVAAKPIETTARREPDPPAPAPLPEPLPVRAPEPLPSSVLVGPVVTVAADARDREGVIEATRDTTASAGPGAGGGTGSGQGPGNGEGRGAGIGDGMGGGTGGGPYRPGSGISAPRLVREVKAEYTDEARRRNLTGDVVLEIVVRRDGSVGDVTILQSLGAGLDQRAVAAVRQWRFDPARRLGTPVDVIVEVAVEFTLR